MASSMLGVILPLPHSHPHPHSPMPITPLNASNLSLILWMVSKQCLRVNLTFPPCEWCAECGVYWFQGEQWLDELLMEGRLEEEDEHEHEDDEDDTDEEEGRRVAVVRGPQGTDGDALPYQTSERPHRCILGFTRKLRQLCRAQAWNRSQGKLRSPRRCQCCYQGKDRWVSHRLRKPSLSSNLLSWKALMSMSMAVSMKRTEPYPSVAGHSKMQSQGSRVGMGTWAWAGAGAWAFTFEGEYSWAFACALDDNDNDAFSVSVHFVVTFFHCHICFCTCFGLIYPHTHTSISTRSSICNPLHPCPSPTWTPNPSWTAPYTPTPRAAFGSSLGG